MLTLIEMRCFAKMEEDTQILALMFVMTFILSWMNIYLAILFYKELLVFSIFFGLFGIYMLIVFVEYLRRFKR